MSARLLRAGLVQRHEGHAINDEATQPIAPSVCAAIKAFGASYLARYADRVPYAHRKAMQAIENCRTAVLGGHVVECGSCSTQDYAYHSCRHRSCPKCMHEENEQWFEARRHELLPVPYFHVVFTVPDDLREVVRGHQQALYPVLMQAASRTLVEVARSPEHLGGTPCVMATLHTWSNTLIHHFHVHCLVSAGAVDKQGKWCAAKGPRLAPESILGKEFRTNLRAMMNGALKGLELPEEVFDIEWQVHAEQPKHGAETVLRYLGHSLHCGPLSDYRILEVTDKEVVFKHRADDGRKWRTMRLAGHEFLRRFLQHVWPDRIHKVRYSGLWSRKCRVQLEAIRQQLLAAEPLPSTPATVPATTVPTADTPTEPSPRHWLQCPHCMGQRVILTRFGRGETPPPLRRPALRTSPPTQPP